MAPVIVTERVAFILGLVWVATVTMAKKSICKVFKITTKDLGENHWRRSLAPQFVHRDLLINNVKIGVILLTRQLLHLADWPTCWGLLSHAKDGNGNGAGPSQG